MGIERYERAAIAARVRNSQSHDNIEVALRKSLDDEQQLLNDLLSDRATLNALIKERRAQVEVLSRVAAVFDRWHERDNDRDSSDIEPRTLIDLHESDELLASDDDE